MSTVAPLQSTAAKSPLVSLTSHAGLLLQRKCACGGPTSSSLSGECEECNKKRLQKKLSIGASNDPLEQEANRVADQVLAAPAHSAVSETAPRIQRFTGQGTGGAGTAPASVDRVLSDSGRPLDPAIQHGMEKRFGHDFSRVRVHSGAAAEQSARDVNADAYTVGNNIVFGSGRFAPESHEGRRLLAHELTHVVQQSGGHPASTYSSDPGSIAATSTISEGITASRVGVARTGSSGSEQPPFRLNSSELQELASKMRQLFGQLDAGTQAKILDNDTIALAWVKNEDGEFLVYTVAGNRTYPGLPEAAEKLGIHRWTVLPRAKGRGAIGAPGDAEQLVIEGGDEFGFEIGGVTVSRKVCPDCAEALRAAERGEIPVLEVQIRFPKIKIPSTTPPANDNAIPGGLGPANDNAIPRRLGPANDNAIPRRLGPANDNAIPEGPSPAPAVVEGAEGTLAGAALRGIAMLAIAIAIQVFLQWALSKLFELQIRNDITNILDPQLAKKLEQLKSKIASLKSNKKLFIRIGYEFKYTRSTDPILGAPPLYVPESLRLSYVHPGHEELNFEPTSDEYPEKAGPLTELVTHKIGYAVLLDDPEKRALEKERADLTDRLNRIAKQQQSKSPSPKPSSPPQPQAAPLLSPPSAPAPALSPSFLQGPGGQVGPSKAEQADQALKTLEQNGNKLVERGLVLQGQKNSGNRLATDDFIKDEDQWRTFVDYWRNWSAREGLDSRVKEFRDLLGDPSRPGQKLEKLRQDLTK